MLKDTLLHKVTQGPELPSAVSTLNLPVANSTEGEREKDGRGGAFP
jgi:hypothetical protein